MARIEELIQAIPEVRLREELTREVKKLKSSKKFGLVFEGHLPETIRIPSLPLKAGELVAFKNEGANNLWRIEQLKAGKVELAAEHGTERRAVRQDEVAVVRRFGDPIYPSLVPVDRVSRSDDKPWHTLIEADNFHALQLLLYTCEEKVDVIYIDPPYNTGARDWKYNNDYVDGNDAWRHSKWLSFIEKRLRLAKRLLKPNGVLIVTIDEHEVNNLGVLLRQVLPDARVQMVTIVTNTAGSMSPGLFSRAEEYAYFCFFGDSKPCPLETDLLAESKPTTQFWFPLFRSRGLNDRPSKRPNLVYPIAIDPKTLKVKAVGRSLKERRAAGEISGNLDNWKPPRDEKLGGLPVIWPVLETGEVTTWQMEASSLVALAKEGFVRTRKRASNDSLRSFTISYVKSGNRKKVASGEVKVSGREPSGALILENGSRKTIPKSTWKVAAHDARLYGTTMLRSILGPSTFTYPKSPYAVADAIQSILADNPEGLVLDFFAGSGTTLQATALLNSRDGGRRRCILVTNNEVTEAAANDLNAKGHFEGDLEYEKAGIARTVTWPRCKFAIQGKRDDGTPLEGSYLDGTELKDGFAENAEYFRLNFLDPSEVSRGEAFEAVLPILWFMAGCKGSRESSRGSQPWFIPKGNGYAVLLRESHFVAFRKEVLKMKDVPLVFLVTDSEDSFRDMSASLEGFQTVMLYKSYLENFRINTSKTHED